MSALRKLILGETWSLPIGVAAALGAAAVVRSLSGAGGWWHSAGGFVLLGLLLAALTGALAGALRAR